MYIEEDELLYPSVFEIIDVCTSETLLGTDLIDEKLMLIVDEVLKGVDGDSVLFGYVVSDGIIKEVPLKNEDNAVGIILLDVEAFEAV